MGPIECRYVAPVSKGARVGLHWMTGCPNVTVDTSLDDGPSTDYA